MENNNYKTEIDESIIKDYTINNLGVNDLCGELPLN